MVASGTATNRVPLGLTTRPSSRSEPARSPKCSRLWLEIIWTLLLALLGCWPAWSEEIRPPDYQVKAAIRERQPCRIGLDKVGAGLGRLAFEVGTHHGERSAGHVEAAAPGPYVKDRSSTGKGAQ